MKPDGLNLDRYALQLGEAVMYSGHKEANASHIECIGMLLAAEARMKAVSTRALTGQLHTKERNILITECYAQVNDAEEDSNIEFCNVLQNKETTKQKMTL